MTSNKNTLAPGECRIGWLLYEGQHEGQPVVAMLRNISGEIVMTIPISKNDAYSNISRWFGGSSTHSDDPDQRLYSNEPPSEFIFEDIKGTVGLFECRNSGKSYKPLGPAEVKIRVGFVVLGARSFDYARPHRCRSYIPGMGDWLRVSSISINPVKDEKNLIKQLEVSIESPNKYKLMENLYLNFPWSGNQSFKKGELIVYDRICIESEYENGRIFQEHLQLHRAFSELVALAYWKPTGYFDFECSRNEDINTIKPRWRKIISDMLIVQEEAHSNTPLFIFDQIGEEGFQSWIELQSHFNQAFSALMLGVEMTSAPIETQFIQSCVGLEGLGVQIERDGNNGDFGAKGNKHPSLQQRLKLVIDDLGFSFSKDWPKQTADMYNNIKHYDRDRFPDPLDVYYNLLENQLIFRAWAAMKIGVSKDYIMDNIARTPAGRKLVSKEGISFPRP